MTDQTNLFSDADVERRLDDAVGVLHRGAPVARIEFLAGMLAAWTLGPGKNPTAGQKARFHEIARRTLQDAEAAVNQSKGVPK